MKHFNYILTACISIAAMVSSCTFELKPNDVDITSIRCSIPPIDVEEDFATGILDTLSSTKATFSGNSFLWSAGDRIGIVPNSGSQIYFAVDAGAGTSNASFDGGDWAMKSTGTFFAYYPLYPDIFLSKNHVSVAYTGQVQSGNNNNLHTGQFWTLYTGGTSAEGNTLSFTFNHLTSFFKTYVTVPAGTYTKIAFSAPSEIFIREGYFDLGAQTPTIVGTTFTNELCLDLQNVTFADETELTGYLVLAPVDITGVPITVTVYKDGAPSYEYTLTKANPMVAAKTYAFRATALTQLASSATQANALFAAGATAVSITEPLTENATIVLPNTSEAVTLTLPATASSSTLTVSYPQNAASYPATVSITGPEGADLDIQTPNSTVTLNGIAYDQVTSRTAANTCIIPVGVTVNNLKVVQGGVQVYGTVTQIDLSEQEDDAIISVSGTVTSLLGEDDEEYTPATGISLNQSSINLNVGATETLIATVAPVGAYPDVIWSSSDNAVATVSPTGVVTAVATGSTTITVTTISGGFSATCNVTIRVPATIDGYEYVDLGLSVLWATHNIGATNPEGVGSTFVWAYTSPSSNSSWYNYKYSIYDEGYEDSYLTKYCFNDIDGIVIDNLQTLMPIDDAAYVNWGDHWRMPNKQEFDDLIIRCSWLETSTGYIVTGPNGNSIFLPFKRYWTSTLEDFDGNDDYNSCNSWRAWTLNRNTMESGVRINAYNVRPVGSLILPTSVTLSNSSLSLTVGSNAGLTASVLPSDASKTVIWTSSNPGIAKVNSSGLVTGVSKGKAIITATSDFGNITATCEVTVSKAKPYNAVDLGVTTSDGYKVYWAQSNLCESGFAGAAWEYGDYFAWGEVIPHYESGYAQSSSPVWKEGMEGYSWANYKWCSGTSTTITKYNNDSSYGTVDNQTQLIGYDDAVIKIVGNGWRMPTKTDWEALCNTDNFEWTWMDSYYNGVKGAKVTSKIPGYEGNTIFLPAAGHRFITYISNYSAGWAGIYWSSSLYTDDPSKAWSFQPKGYNTNPYINKYARYEGQSIRAVYD